MHTRSAAALALLALSIVACGGGTTSNDAPVVPGTKDAAPRVRVAATGNVVTNPLFATGALNDGWSSCGTVAASVSTAASYGGSGYSALAGSTAKPEVNGTSGVCQTIAVPANATLTFWVYQGTDDSISYVDQEADVRSTSGATLATLYKVAASSGGWVEKSFSLSAYAGQTVTLYFGVKGNGYAKDYVYQYLDDVSVTGTGSPAPSPSPTPSAGPTSSPTPTASASPYPCSDAQFVTDQSEFASGKITADQLVDVCGNVTQVLPAKTTSSGRHGYFYVSIPGSASPGTIEIVSNLDAMAEAPSGDPPAWPWVAVGDYVYVQGRYYYDDSSSQGIDWTEDDTDSSWEHTGYVAVCSSAGTGCVFYQ